jgi:hypothetical protein
MVTEPSERIGNMVIISKCDILATPLQSQPQTSPAVKIVDTDTVVDALGRKVNPHTSYVWTPTSVTATFRAAISSQYLPDCKLHAVIPITKRAGLHAVVEHVRTGKIGLYALNSETARPYLVAECSPDRLIAMLQNPALFDKTS